MTLTAKTRFILIMATAIFVILFLIGAQSYFHGEELKLLNEGCHKNSGTVVMETTFLNLNYSFSCE